MVRYKANQLPEAAFPKPGPRKKKSGRKADGSKAKHDLLQAECENYLNAEGIPFIHIPDSLLSFLFAPYLGQALQKNLTLYGWLQKVKKDVSDYLQGMPDIVLPERGFELKTGAATQNQGQKKWAENVPTEVIRDYEQFKGAVNK